MSVRVGVLGRGEGGGGRKLVENTYSHHFITGYLLYIHVATVKAASYLYHGRYSWSSFVHSDLNKVTNHLDGNPKPVAMVTTEERGHKRGRWRMYLPSS